jgi:hypothetical protein
MDLAHLVKSSWRNRLAEAVGICVLFGALAPCGAILAAGQPGAFLRAPVGASGFALGGANSVSPDYLSLWWNPAALASIKSRQLTIGTGYRTLGRTDGVAAWEFRVPPRVSIGLSLLYRGDPFLDNLYDEQEYKLDRGSYTTITTKVGASYLINRRLSAGASLSIFYQRLPVGYNGSQLIYSGGMSDLSIGGVDLGVRYGATEKLTLGIVVKNLGAGVKMRTAGSQFYDIEINEKFPPIFIVGSELKSTLAKKPFIWSCDLVGYPLTGEFKKAEKPEVVINNGFEWQGFDKLFIRAGIRDLAFTSDIVNDSRAYQAGFSLAITGGCRIDLSGALKGLAVNYAVATSKIWRGLEQQLDCVYLF